MRTPIINHENANVELPKNRFKVGDIVMSVNESNITSMISRNIIGVVMDIPSEFTNIYKVKFQSHYGTNFVWDFQLQKFIVRE